jgi:hypothetical protein
MHPRIKMFMLKLDYTETFTLFGQLDRFYFNLILCIFVLYFVVKFHLNYRQFIDPNEQYNLHSN